MKKVISTLLISLFILGSCFSSVYASGGYVSLSYRNYNIPGSVDGSKNGVFYKLSKGRVKLNVTETNSNNGEMRISLKRSRFGIDKEYGEVIVKGKKTYTWGVDTNSDKYYLFAYGGKSGTTQYLKGKISN